MRPAVTVQPEDIHNKTLVSNVHPQDWINPEPKEKYNLVVIGAGTAGLISAIGAASLGARVALVEKHLMGGDCLNVGCVPSKGLIRSSRAFAAVRDAGAFGVDVPAGTQVNFPRIMERMRRLRAHISRNDSVKRYSEMGIDVFLGEASFCEDGVIEVDGKQLRSAKCALATGARAAELGISGLAEAGYLTNETVFALTELPKRFGVIGAGPIGAEMAQAFQRFGSDVTVIERSDQILSREDSAAAAIVEEHWRRDGVTVVKNAILDRVEKRGDGRVMHVTVEGQKKEIVVDQVLVGIGRQPNVEGLNLEKVGVKYDTRSGVFVNDHLQTTNPRIFAAGDIASKFKFTHMAEALAGILIQNALFSMGPLGKKKASDLIVPWCTYTDPEVAHVGLYESEAMKNGIRTETFVHRFEDLDRAILDGEDDGFVKVLAKKGTGEILGATIVASHAGDLISELTVAMNAKVTLGTLASVIHPYPTQAEGIKRAGGHFRRTKLTPSVKKWMIRWLNLTR